MYCDVFTHAPSNLKSYICYYVRIIGAGTFGTVRLGIYRPKNGEPEMKCALKCLKPNEELPNQKVLVHVHIMYDIHVHNYVLHIHMYHKRIMCYVMYALLTDYML